MERTNKEKIVFMAVLAVILVSMIGLVAASHGWFTGESQALAAHDDGTLGSQDSPLSPDAPHMVFNASGYDLGTIHQQGGLISMVFSVTNTGKDDLIIDGLQTSCMCTSAMLIHDGQRGPVSGKDAQDDDAVDTLVLASGESATLKVFYDPLAHGMQTEDELRIFRYVTIFSNDPLAPEKKVLFALTQVKE